MPHLPNVCKIPPLLDLTAPKVAAGKNVQHESKLALPLDRGVPQFSYLLNDDFFGATDPPASIAERSRRSGRMENFRSVLSFISDIDCCSLRLSTLPSLLLIPSSLTLVEGTVGLEMKNFA